MSLEQVILFFHLFYSTFPRITLILLIFFNPSFHHSITFTTLLFSIIYSPSFVLYYFYPIPTLSLPIRCTYIIYNSLPLPYFVFLAIFLFSDALSLSSFLSLYLSFWRPSLFILYVHLFITFFYFSFQLSIFLLYVPSYHPSLNLPVSFSSSIEQNYLLNLFLLASPVFVLLTIFPVPFPCSNKYVSFVPRIPLPLVILTRFVQFTC